MPRYYQKTEHVDLWRFAELLKHYFEQSPHGIKIRSNKVLQHIIKTYFTACINKAIREGVGVSLDDAGHIQVLEMVSRKDFKWDEKYNGKDYKLIWHSEYVEVVSKFDAKFTEEVLKKALKGISYQTDIVCHEKRLEKVILLLGRNKRQQQLHEGKERWKKKQRESSLQNETQNSSADAESTH